jgi:hypothetical protein
MGNKIIWRPVKGLEDRYEVSNTGLVRTKPRVLKSFPMQKGGHHQINLGLHRRTYVHRLVAETFLEEPHPSRVWVNHKNGDPSDNRVENLEWCTPGENIAHGFQHNGRVNYNCRGVCAVDDAGEVRLEFGSISAAAKSLGVTPGAVKSAAARGGKCRGYYWVFS